MVTNAPVADADVTVSSEGKIYSAKTGAQGVATFTALYLFPTSTFLVSKTGYAATRILNQYVTSGPVRLWNTSESSNEISGNLYIETDLTNLTPEKVGANVLITASAAIPASPYGGSYTVSFPAYTTADGTYSLKVPAAPNGYSLAFEQIAADQKLYVNATEDDAITSFPNSLPRLTTIKTYFNVNAFNAPVPAVNNYYYFKFSPDKTGRILYLPGFYNYYYYNQILASSIGDKYQVERIITNNYNINGYLDVNTFNYDANSKIDVQLVDVAGNIIQSAPQLAGLTGTNGKLLNYISSENGSGYVHLKRNDAGIILDKGLLLKANVYDTYSNLYNLNFGASLNTSSNRPTSSSFLLSNKGDKKVINFYYGSGDSRVKQVY